AAVARLNVFNYVGFLIGSPLVGALGDASANSRPCGAPGVAPSVPGPGGPARDGDGAGHCHARPCRLGPATSLDRHGA
ncbi:MFS transporter, partial [Streptomyces flaveolus]